MNCPSCADKDIEIRRLRRWLREALNALPIEDWERVVTGLLKEMPLSRYEETP